MQGASPEPKGNAGTAPAAAVGKSVPVRAETSAVSGFHVPAEPPPQAARRASCLRGARCVGATRPRSGAPRPREFRRGGSRKATSRPAPRAPPACGAALRGRSGSGSWSPCAQHSLVGFACRERPARREDADAARTPRQAGSQRPIAGSAGRIPILNPRRRRSWTLSASGGTMSFPRRSSKARAILPPPRFAPPACRPVAAPRAGCACRASPAARRSLRQARCRSSIRPRACSKRGWLSCRFEACPRREQPQGGISKALRLC